MISALHESIFSNLTSLFRLKQEHATIRIFYAPSYGLSFPAHIHFLSYFVTRRTREVPSLLHEKGNLFRLVHPILHLKGVKIIDKSKWQDTMLDKFSEVLFNELV